MRGLISCIGTGSYERVNYQLDDQSFETPYTAVAICALLPEHKKPEQIKLFTTKEAFETHSERLSAEFRLLGVDPLFIPTMIPTDEASSWTLFNAVVRETTSYSSVILDTTHAFRSLSLIMSSALNYCRAVDDTSIEHIFYGCYEAKYTNSDNEVVVPLNDLTAIVEISSWANAVQSFRYTGSTALMQQVIKKGRVTRLLKDSQGQDQAAAKVKGLTKQLEFFSDELSLSRGPAIPERVKKVKSMLLSEEFKRSLPEAFQPILAAIAKELSSFEGSLSEHSILAARWCVSRGLYPQAATLLQEGLISHILGAISEKENILSRAAREAVPQACNIAAQEIPKEKWSEKAKANKVLVTKLRDYFIGDQAFSKLLSQTSIHRNEINHGGFNTSPVDADKLKKGILKTVEEACDLILS